MSKMAKTEEELLLDLAYQQGATTGAGGTMDFPLGGGLGAPAPVAVAPVAPPQRSPEEIARRRFRYLDEIRRLRGPAPVPPNFQDSIARAKEFAAGVGIGQPAYDEDTHWLTKLGLHTQNVGHALSTAGGADPSAHTQFLQQFGAHKPVLNQFVSEYVKDEMDDYRDRRSAYEDVDGLVNPLNMETLLDEGLVERANLNPNAIMTPDEVQGVLAVWENQVNAIEDIPPETMAAAQNVFQSARAMLNAGTITSGTIVKFTQDLASILRGAATPEQISAFSEAVAKIVDPRQDTKPDQG